MKQQLLHTPEGVRDIYNGECERKLCLEEKVYHTLRTYGYHPIETPSFEYADVFGMDIGSTKSRELYKFFDREGDTLALRPDITPSIARAAAKYYMEEDLPIRLCYKGNIFLNTDSLQLRLKERTQLGAELIGDDTADADAELLSMLVECLLAAGLKDFQITVGHVGVLQGMMDAAGLGEEEKEALTDLISNNNFFGVQEFLDARALDEDLIKLFTSLGRIYQSPAEWEVFQASAGKYAKVQSALAHLEQLQKSLLLYGIDKYISFEFGVISDHRYYSGIIFSGYTFGSGEPIVRGGRYDKLLGHFGKDAPSIGFAIFVDQLMAALSRQNVKASMEHNTELVIYDEAHREDAIVYAKRQRLAGCNVELILKNENKTHADYSAYAERNQIGRMQFMDGE